MPDNSFAEINPQVKGVTVGIRNLRTIHIYPLSVHDQLSMTEMINDMTKKFFEQADSTQLSATVGLVLGIVADYIRPLIKMITDREELQELKYTSADELLKDISNNQLINIVKVVYEENFAELSKNLQSLFGTNQENDQDLINELVSRRPSPPSANTSEGIDSNTLHGSDIGKEDAPSDSFSSSTEEP